MARTGRLAGLFLPGWHIVSNVSDADVTPIITAAGEHTRLDHTIKIARQPAYYIWKYVIPLCFIVLMSWSVFWLDPEHVGEQIGVATATTFALIAFLISLRQGLPQVAYLTRLDQLAVSATVLVFLALGEAIVTSRLTQRGQSELGRSLDRYGRWLFLGIFVAVLFVTLVL